MGHHASRIDWNTCTDVPTVCALTTPLTDRATVRVCRQVPDTRTGAVAAVTVIFSPATMIGYGRFVVDHTSSGSGDPTTIDVPVVAGDGAVMIVFAYVSC